MTQSELHDSRCKMFQAASDKLWDEALSTGKVKEYKGPFSSKNPYYGLIYPPDGVEWSEEYVNSVAASVHKDILKVSARLGNERGAIDRPRWAFQDIPDTGDHIPNNLKRHSEREAYRCMVAFPK